MISANQNGPSILLGIILAFSSCVNATQVQIVKSQSRQRQDWQALNNPKANDDKEGDSDGSIANGSSDQVKSANEQSSERHLQKNVRLELVANLRKQSSLKQQIEHLTNESESHQEIEDSAKLVANETESVEMADMLSNMWKDMRMFDVPAYERHVEHELHHLKADEEVLEAKLNGRHMEAKLKGEHAEDNEEKKHKDEEDEKKGAKHNEEEAEEEEEVAAKVFGFGGQKSTMIFWRMSHADQKSVLSASLVYLVGGVLCAVLFKLTRAKYFKLEDSLEGHPNGKGFSFPIFGCLGADLRLCALGFFCPCLTWANNVERRLKVWYWQGFLVFFGLLLLHVYSMGISSIALVFLGVFYRQKLRDSYGMDSFESGATSTVAVDFLLWCFCQPCVIIQEAREETANREEDQEA